MLTDAQIASIKARKLIVTKGCKALGVRSNERLSILEITPMGAEFSHAAKLRVAVGGRAMTLWVAHPNRLLRSDFNLTCGGSETIRVN